MIQATLTRLFLDGKELKLGKFISKESFVKYLKAEVKNDRKYTCSATHCPLAEATGYVVDGINYGLVDYEDELIGPTKRLPEWASSFVSMFDDSGFHEIPKGKSAKRALFIMENFNRCLRDYRGDSYISSERQ